MLTRNKTISFIEIVSARQG